MHCQRQEE